MNADTTRLKPDPVSMGALALASEIGAMQEVGSIARGPWRLEVKLGRDSLWAFTRCADGPAFAVRTAWSPGGGLVLGRTVFVNESASLEVGSPIGQFEVRLGIADEEHMAAHGTVSLTPARDLLIPFWPRDLYPLGAEDDPLASRGEVHASQRGFNAAIVFFTMQAPEGAALYFQNLTALNAFSQMTRTKPDGVVTGRWPELGYQPAVSTDAPSPPEHPLRQGLPVVVSDWILQAQPEAPEREAELGRLFVSWLSLAYRRTAKDEVAFCDWPARAEQTLRHLSTVKAATQEFYGHRYVRPYLDAEPPDSMVQLAVVSPLTEYARWKGGEPKLLGELRGGLRKFWNSELGMFGRFLPNVGDEKDADRFDSWYLYHPLTKLGRLALGDDKYARKLFFDALPYAIRAARRFGYNWPVFFNPRTFKVIQQTRKDGEPGQSDVGGLYAYVMLQAHELDGKPQYLDEATNALRALSGHGFDVEYQANLTAHGAVACLKYWRATGDTSVRDESYYLIASFFHNSILWESDIEAARHYSTLLGASALHNGPYTAMYECWECFLLFSEYLEIGQDDIDAEVHFMLSEYCRRALHRAWFYYPVELPKDVLCEKPRSGKIDRRFAFPLEDLYAGGDPPGTVGQEVYGCGAAWAFTVKSFRRPNGANFLVAPETPLLTFEQADEGALALCLAGRQGGRSRIRIIPDRNASPEVRLCTEAGEEIAPSQLDRGWEFDAPQRQKLVLNWAAGGAKESIGNPARRTQVPSV